MPGHREDFVGGSNETPYSYEFEKWKTQEGSWNSSISEDQLPQVASIVFKVENQDTGGIAYNTLTGPFDDWETVGEIFEYNWGPEGDSNVLP